jgi:hypothetical protein
LRVSIGSESTPKHTGLLESLLTINSLTIRWKAISGRPFYLITKTQRLSRSCVRAVHPARSPLRPAPDEAQSPREVAADAFQYWRILVHLGSDRRDAGLNFLEDKSLLLIIDAWRAELFRSPAKAGTIKGFQDLGQSIDAYISIGVSGFQVCDLALKSIVRISVKRDGHFGKSRTSVSLSRGQRDRLRGRAGTTVVS